MAKSVGNIRLLHEALDDVRPRRAASCTSAAATTASRSPTRRSALERGGAPRRAHPRRGRRLVPGDVAGRAGAAAGALLRRAGRRLQHARSALAAVFEWVREANRRAEPASVGDADLREMLGVLGLENLLERRRGRAREAARSSLERREAARAASDFAAADRLRDELPALRLGGARRADGPRARARARDAVIVYGRKPGRARRCRGRRGGAGRCWATRARGARSR